MAKNTVLVLGIILTLVGIWGFFAQGSVLGFAVDTTHNVIHLVTGLLGIWYGTRNESQAKMYAKVFGVIYGLVTIIGFVQSDTVLNLFGVNVADNILHLILAVIWLWLGFAGGKSSMMASSGPSMGSGQSM